METTSRLQFGSDLQTTAQTHLTDCRLCPFRCGKARASAEGRCRIGAQAHIASEMLHMGEEAILRPAHAVFFSGCTATCTFCTAARFAFRPTYGVVVPAQQLARRVIERQAQGARSLAFIGGDPAPHLPYIVEVRAALGDDLRIPLVLNTNLFVSDEALNLAQAVVDLYLPDLKFGPPGAHGDCGAALGEMPDYWRVVTGAIDRLRTEGAQILVRHLLMPGHFDCCTAPVLRWLGARRDLRVSLLTQYLPPAHARGALAQPLSEGEIDRARSLANKMQLTLEV